MPTLLLVLTRPSLTIVTHLAAYDCVRFAQLLLWTLTTRLTRRTNVVGLLPVTVCLFVLVTVAFDKIFFLYSFFFSFSKPPTNYTHLTNNKIPKLISYIVVSFAVRKMLEDTQLVWVRDPLDGYIQGRITEIGSKEFEVTPIDRKFAKRTCHYDDIHSSCDGPQDHDDNCKYIKSICLTHVLSIRTYLYICVCGGFSVFIHIFPIVR